MRHLLLTFVTDTGFPTPFRAEGSKGNPVKIRDYPRSCEFHFPGTCILGHC